MRKLECALINYLQATRSARTSDAYAKIARRFLLFVGERAPNRRAIERFLAHPLGNGARPAPQTRNQVLAGIRALARCAVQSGVWASDPTHGIPFLREPSRDPAVLSISEVHRLFRALDEVSPPVLRARDRAILALLFTVGLRVHELVGLDVDQVDAASATLVAVRGKGGTVHDLPIEPGTLALVQRWVEQRSAIAKRREAALFVSRRGTRLSIRSVERLFERMRAATGTRKKVTPHTARHSAATLAIMAGGDVSAVGELLRHADLNTTRRYLHLVDTRRRQVVTLLSAAIPPELTPPIPAEPHPHVRSVDRPAVAVTASSVLGQVEPISEPWTENVSPANDALDAQDDLDDVTPLHDAGAGGRLHR